MQLKINNVNSHGEIRKLIREFAEEDLYIAMPAKIVNIDNYESLQVVSVKPCIDQTFPDYNDEKVLANTMKKVFVKLPAGGGFSITMPVAVGDLCTLHWSHRDLSDFLDGNGSDVTQPKNYIANIEDCWVELGFGTRKNHQSPSATDLVIKSDNTTITITPEGEIDINTASTTKVTSSAHTINTDLTVTGNNSTTGNTILTGNLAVTGTTTHTGNLDFSTLSNLGVAGVSGVFTSQYGSITITNGIITAIA